MTRNAGGNVKELRLRGVFDCPVKTGTTDFGDWEDVHIRLNCEDWYNEVQYKTRTEERPDLGDE
jgi:hypothetical protein